MSAADAGERDLTVLLRTLSPQLLPEQYVFCQCQEKELAQYLALSPKVMVREAQGVTLVLEYRDAQSAGFPCSHAMRCITLTVHSSLQAVGLTAAISTALATEDISANVVAGFFHDHVFVPTAQAERALQVLADLQRA